MGVPLATHPQGFRVGTTGGLSSYSQWGPQIWIEVAFGRSDLFAPGTDPHTHLLGPQNPLGTQASRISISQKKHNFCGSDYR